METSTITLTAGECAENHVGMEKIGELSDKGFTLSDLKKMKTKFEDIECKCELIHLNSALNDDSSSSSSSDDSDDEKEKTEDAYILIIREGLDALIKKHVDNKLNSEAMFKEHVKLPWDTKYFDTRRQKVLNKNARYNLCYGDNYRKPDYKNKKGTIIAYSQVPITKKIMSKFDKYFGVEDMNLEGNYYYDVKKCYIGFHQDRERRKVIGLRLGSTFPLYYHWFYKYKPVGKTIKLHINGGDIYVMNEKATGCNNKKNEYGLRHAAGDKKHFKI